MRGPQAAGRPQFEDPVSAAIWETRYRYRARAGTGDSSIADSWQRVARAVARAEPAAGRARWRARFAALMADFAFLPGGRILAGAGTGRRVTLLNCFVMGPIHDSMNGIFRALREGAVTMQQGGGVGYDFSSLRPAGTPARGIGTVASGPVSFMRVWDRMCATVLSTGTRRGAMMATLHCEHPDVERFVDAKRDPADLRHFNVSVLVTDALMQAVRCDGPWALRFPPGTGEVVRTVPARDLWRRIMQAAYDSAEPGVLFIDRINRMNNLAYREHISATNPCGEVPLPPWGACDLGSFNLTRFVRDPFSASARLDLAALAKVVPAAVRLLDNVIDISRFPLAAQRREARAARRIGLGVTGLADALIMLGLRYDSPAGREAAAAAMRTLCHAAYRASVALAREKGAFPAFRRDAYLAAPFVAALPGAIRDAISRHGVRNSHLLAIAPTGTVSLLAGNVSSGIEPVFDLHYRRRILAADGGYRELTVTDPAWRLWNSLAADRRYASAMVTAEQVAPDDHLYMQAALQPHVDNAISKTVNVPRELPFEVFSTLYRKAWELDLKGCTAFRANPVTGAVLCRDGPGAAASHCCAIEREAD